MATTFIYALCEPGTRTVRYIGKTNNLKNRAQQHRRNTKQMTCLGYWLRSLAGARPEMLMLREVPGDGSEAERRYIRLARGCRMDLVNATDGGEGTPGYIHTPEQNTAKSARMTGVPHTPERCANISAAWTPELRAARSARMTGVSLPPHTPEQNAAKSARMTGVPKTPETRAAISAAWTPERRAAQSARQKGVPKPLETCTAISATMTGVPHTPERCANIRAAWTPERRSAVGAARLGHKRSEESKAKQRTTIAARKEVK